MTRAPSLDWEVYGTAALDEPPPPGPEPHRPPLTREDVFPRSDPKNAPVWAGSPQGTEPTGDAAVEQFAVGPRQAFVVESVGAIGQRPAVVGEVVRGLRPGHGLLRGEPGVVRSSTGSLS